MLARSLGEVYYYPLWVVVAFVIAAVFAQAQLPLYVPWLARMDLPLLVTIYFGLFQRNPLRGLAIGMASGILQDTLTHGPIGMNGFTKTLVGFLSSSVSAKFNVERATIRAVFILFFSLVNLFLFALLEKILFERRFTWAHYHPVTGPLANMVLGWGVFLLGDRFRRTF